MELEKSSYIAYGDGYRKQKQRFIFKNQKWNKEIARFKAIKGKWVLVNKGFSTEESGSNYINSVNYLYGYPLMSGIEIEGLGFMPYSVLPKNQRKYSFYPLLRNSTDYFESYGQFTVSNQAQNQFGIYDGYGCLSLDGGYLQAKGRKEADWNALTLFTKITNKLPNTRFFEVKFHFNLKNIPSNNNVYWLFYSGNADGHIGIYVTKDGKMAWHIEDKKQSQILTIPVADTVIKSGQWYGVRIKYAPKSNASIYLDGELKGVAPSSIGFCSANPEPLFWGSGRTSKIDAGGNAVVGSAWTTTPMFISCIYLTNEQYTEQQLDIINEYSAVDLVFTGLDGQMHNGSKWISTINYKFWDPIHSSVIPSNQTAKMIYTIPDDLPSGRYNVTIRARGKETNPVPIFIGPKTVLQKKYTETFDNPYQFLDMWTCAHKAWGGKNGGVISENVFINENNELVLRAQGDLATSGFHGVNNKGERIDRYTRVGNSIVSKDYMGPGSYIVEAKMPPKTGACFAMWTFHYEEVFPGDPRWQSLLDEGLSIQGTAASGYYIVRNHEIDIETPTALKGAPDMEITSWENCRFNNWHGELESEYTDAFVDCQSNLSDGEYHEYRFDWHVDDNPRVEFYIDGVLKHINYDFTPNIVGKLWIGYWFPSAPNNHWAGKVADWVEQSCLVRKFEFIPFIDEHARTISESYPFDVFRTANYSHLRLNHRNGGTVEEK